MEHKFIISIDQSTQGTKALLFDGCGKLLAREDLAHRQLVNAQGWVSHDLREIADNTVRAVWLLLEKNRISSAQIVAVGISNQRETTAMWDSISGEPLADAVVWQCGRAGSIARDIAKQGFDSIIKEKTGIPLSAYFPAAKMAWLLRQGEGLAERAGRGEICLGTIDSWLIWQLSQEHAFKTDYSNASRTQLMNLKTLAWDEELAGIFGIPMECLAQICDSDAVYGHTTMNGLFENPVPICGVLGDSHAALFGQGCLQPGMSKATYGTGSSLMMNIGGQPIASSHGVVTSLAWKRKGKVDYVLEGNLNYTGAVITWLKEDVGLISFAGETESLAAAANPADRTYLVPAFTGLGAPYWDESAAASISGMTRVTGKAEIVRAALDCIAYQITDLVLAMEQDTGIPMKELRVDGGPTRNRYLMQFQSDISAKLLKIPQAEELSGIGAAYMAGISAGLYSEDELFSNWEGSIFAPSMDKNVRRQKLDGWKKAVAGVLDHT
ncbi:FGGY-family carbohydrate kinase [Eisenbergiella sp.]